MSRLSAALLLCLVTAGHAFRQVKMDKMSTGEGEDDAADDRDCCCKSGPCKDGQQDWDESMKYHILENKCCKLRNKDCERSWLMDLHPYTEKSNKDMCEDPEKSCARSWKGTHFDTVKNSTSCDGGTCVAFEISEEHDYPILTVHMGAYWGAARDTETDGIKWKPFPANPKASLGMFVLSLREIDHAKMMPDGSLAFEKAGYQVMVINAGLYHDESFVTEGVRVLDSLERVNASELESSSLLEAASDSQLQAASESQGFIFGTLVVGGFYSAATASGVVVSNSAAVGGVVAVGAVTGIIGAVIAGPIVGPAALLMVFLRAHEVEEDSATKVWSMLKCHSDFKQCSDDTIVPTQKDCPKE